jgi:hypothetical protein
VIDAERNAVALTTTINTVLGSKAHTLARAHGRSTLLGPTTPAAFRRARSRSQSHSVVADYSLCVCACVCARARVHAAHACVVQVMTSGGVLLNNEMDDFSTPNQAPPARRHTFTHTHARARTQRTHTLHR